MRKHKNEIGITLIALTITIIVLLILAGVTIAAISGDNGILQNAARAKEETEQAQKDEENILNSYEDKINEYIEIDWDTVLANAQKHPDQKTSTAIGVGTDGRAVNMDLWECTLLEDGTYALNDSASVAITGTRTAGYTGNIVDGKIEGTIPQYIKDESDGSFIEVTSIQWLFYQKTELATSPKIPDTITNMYNTFNGCTNLITVGEIPDSVTNMQGTFNGCTSLTTVTSLPNNLENMSYTFQNCSKLITVCDIPNNVTNMQGTFYGCTSLTKVTSLPNNLENMSYTFQNCSKLITVCDIPNNVTNMEGTFFKCTSLIIAPEISSSVTNMHSTFQNCTNLTTVGIIPNSVINMQSTFNGCTNLQGEIIINANLTGAILDEEANIKDYQGVLWNACMTDGITLKLSGTCPVLQEMVSAVATNSSNITLAE